MKRLLPSLLILLAVLLLCCACGPVLVETAEDPLPQAEAEPAPEAAEKAPAKPLMLPVLRVRPTETLFLAAAELNIYAHSGGGVQHRVYQLPDGTLAAMGRAVSEGGPVELETWTAAGLAGTVRYYDAEGVWTETPLEAGEYRASTIEIQWEDGTVWFLYAPKSYIPRERGSLEYQPELDGCLRVSQENGRWQFTVEGSGPVCDYTLVRGHDALLSWIHENCPDTWQNYTQDGAGKWCFDGYYRTTPSTYTPTGDHYIYRCPASYVVRSLALAAEENSTAAALTLAMLETLSRNQNDAGYWTTEPESHWLSKSYGVGPGFYDTRFNTDLMEIYVYVYPRFGGEFLRETMTAYASFYLSFAEGHHQETENGGWLVEDYWHPDGSEPLHCSLNHQLAECLTAFHLADVLNRQDLRDLAQRLLTAVEDTADHWIKKNQDLYYRIQPDGTYCGDDYPYLTYNDLYDLQAYLEETGQGRSEPLDRLMQSKQKWMDANGITAYKQ